MDDDKKNIWEKLEIIKEYYPELVSHISSEMSIEELEHDYQIALNGIDNINRESNYQSYRKYAELFYSYSEVKPDEEKKWKEILDFVYDKICINEHDDNIEDFIDKINEVFSSEEAENITNLMDQIKQHTSGNTTLNSDEMIKYSSDRFLISGFYMFIFDERFKSYIKSKLA